MFLYVGSAKLYIGSGRVVTRGKSREKIRQLKAQKFLSKISLNFEHKFPGSAGRALRIWYIVRVFTGIKFLHLLLHVDSKTRWWKQFRHKKRLIKSYDLHGQYRMLQQVMIFCSGSSPHHSTKTAWSRLKIYSNPSVTQKTKKDKLILIINRDQVLDTKISVRIDGKMLPVERRGHLSFLDGRFFL